ncbi:MAG: VanZ family protein [Bacillota bacterium]|nr:VanZ family protein [Bacillota bacterium]
MKRLHRLMDYKKVIKPVVLWVPAGAWMAVIFYFSAQAKGSPTLEHFPAPAGIGHFVGYALLGFLLYRAFNGGLKGWSLQAAGYALLVGFLYAVSDELHQWFVPGREAAFYDVLIDLGGTAMGVLLLRIGNLSILRKPGN